MTWKINGETITPAQGELLKRLASGPVAIADADGRCVNALERRGYVTSEVEEVRITAKGKAIAAKLNGGGAAPVKASRSPAPRTREQAKPAGILTDAEYNRIRGEIEARYQADLAALDRVHAIVRTIAGDGLSEDLLS